MKVNRSLLLTFTYVLVLLLTLTAEEQNYYIRRFIVVQPEGGLGCRISGVVSAGFLSYLTSRVLVIDWQSSTRLEGREGGPRFKDMFFAHDYSNRSAVIYDPYNSFYDPTLPPNANECLLGLPYFTSNISIAIL